MMLRRPRGPKPTAIELTARQRDRLEHIVRSPKSPQGLVRRCRIILLADDGLRNQHIADDLNVDYRMTTQWRGRWHDSAEQLLAAEAESTDKELERLICKVLSDKHRRGRPPTFTPVQICQIIALACEDPRDSGLLITQWTSTALADEAMNREIVESISPASIGRFLKSG